MAVSRLLQTKLGGDNEISKSLSSVPSTGVPLGGATSSATRTDLPANTLGVKAFGNLSKTLGGGQYSIAENPSKLLKTERGLTTFDERQAARGPYFTENVGIDHIVPISLGGTNDPTNLQILPKKEFEKKTVVDNLAYFLYQKGKIPLGIARNLNKNWNNNPSALLDMKGLSNDPVLNETITFDDGRTFSIKDALKQIQTKDYAQSSVVGQPLKVTPKTVFKEIGGIPGTLKKTLNVGEALIGSIPYGVGMAATGQKPFGEATSEYFKKTSAGKEGVFSQPVFKAGVKGAFEGLTGGWIKDTEDIQYKDEGEATLGKGVELLAQAGGFVAGLKGIGALFKTALKGIKGAGIVSEAAQLPGEIGTLGKIKGAFDKTVATARIPQMLSRVENTSLMKSLNQLPAGNFLKESLKNAGLFGIYGQLSKQDENDLEARAKRLVSDLGMGALFGITGKAINTLFPPFTATKITAGTLSNFMVGWMTSKIAGAEDEDALLNGAVFAILHGTGLYGRRGLTKEQIQGESFKNVPTELFPEFYENLNTLRGQKMFQESTTKWFDKFGVKGRIQTKEEINRAVNTVRESIAADYNAGNLTQEQAIAGYKMTTVMGQYMQYFNMPLKERIKLELRDIAYAFSKPKTSTNPKETIKESILDDTSGREFLQRIESVTPNQETLNRVPSLVDSQAMLTGTRRGLPGEARTLANRHLVETVIPTFTANPNTPYKLVLEREPSNEVDPEDAIRATIYINNGPGLPIGYMPSERMVNVQNSGRGSVEQQTGSEHLFNPSWNNRTLREIMDNSGVTKVEANLSPTWLTNLGAGRGVVSGEPYVVIEVGQYNMARAIQAAREGQQEPTQISSTIISTPENRQEIFNKIPQDSIREIVDDIYKKIEDNVRSNDPSVLVTYINSFGNVIRPEEENVISTQNGLQNLTYAKLMHLFINAYENGRLNIRGNDFFDQFISINERIKNTLGTEAFRRFLNTPMAHAQTSVPESPTAEELPEDVITESVTPSEPNQLSDIQSFRKEPVDIVTTDELKPIDTDGNKRNIFINQALIEGVRDVSVDDYNAFSDNGKLNGISKRVVNKIIELMNDGVDRSDPRVSALFEFYNSLDQLTMAKSAKSSLNFEEFLKNIIRKSNDVGIEPFDFLKGNVPVKEIRFYDRYDNNQLQALRRRYNLLKQTRNTETRFELVPSADGKMKMKRVEVKPISPISYLQEKVESFDHSGIEFVRVNNDGKGDSVNFAHGVKLKGNAAEQTQQIHDLLRKENIFMLATQNGKPANAVGVFINPETQKEFIQKFNSNPEAYSVSEVERQNMKELLPDEKIDNDTKVKLVLYKDVLELGSDFSSVDMSKRINILDHRDVKWDESGSLRVLFLPDTELRSLLSYDFLPDKIIREGRQFEEFVKRTQEDGGGFITKEDNQDLRFFMGEQGKGFNAKGTITTALPDGGVLTEKANMGTLSYPQRHYLETKYGIQIVPGTKISFMSNVKTGKDKLKTLSGHPDIKYWDVPKKDMRFLFETPHYNQEGTFSISILGKFSNKDAVEKDGASYLIKDDLVKLFKPATEKWTKAWNEVFRDGNNPVEVFEKYYGKKLEEEGYGKLKTMAKNKSDIISLQKQFETQMISMFDETILRNRDLKAAYLKILPDLGFFDPAVNNWRLLKPGEVMISRHMADDFDNPQSLLISRYPITKKLAMFKGDVLIAEDYNINTLGKDNIITNVYNLYTNLGGDFDGDAAMAFKIIPQDQYSKNTEDVLDGIPESVVNHIEQTRKQYVDQYGEEKTPIGIEADKYPKLPAANSAGLLYVLKSAADAKQQLGGISNASNLANLLVDNKDSELTRGLLTVGGKYYEPRADFDTMDQIEQIIQASVDGTSKQTFSKLSKVDKNAYRYIFNTTDERVLSEIFSNLQNTYLKGFFGNKKMGNVKELTKTLTPFLEVIPENPNLRHPWQEAMIPFKDISIPSISLKQEMDSDIYAGEQLKKTLERPEITQHAKDFIKFVEKWQNDKSDIAASWRNNKTNEELKTSFDTIRDPNIVNNYYYENWNKYNSDDLKAISWFLITDKTSNQWYDPKFYTKNLKDGYYIQRWDDLMLPEHAQAYYQARQVWFNENILKKATEAQNLPPEPPVIENSMNTTSKLKLPNLGNIESQLSLPGLTKQFPTVTDILTTKKGINLKKEVNPDGSFWLEQNLEKLSRWSDLAKEGHKIEHLVLSDSQGGGWAGKIRIDGNVYTYKEAGQKFLK
ncbi:HNH endonuclease [Candidatus Dojkabacteria bacterium]|jgi:hypothetical protein|nr:HNH endonuclease [Candidatus Dojkabacteria bacterium]